MRSIRIQIVLAVIALVAAVLAMFGYIIYVRITDADNVRLDAQLESYAERVGVALEEALDESAVPDTHIFQSLQAEGIDRVSLQLVARSGRLLYIDSSAGRMPAIAYRSLNTACVFSTLEIRSVRYRTAQLNVDSEHGVHCLLEVAAPLTAIESRQAQLRLLLCIAMPMTLLVIAVFVSVIVFRALRPLSSMIRTAQSISAQTLHQRIAIPSGASEVEALASALNKMIERIDDGISAQKQFIADASHELRTPLSVLRAELEYAARFLTSAEAGESLMIAFSEIDHLNKLASSLLTLAVLDASEGRLMLRTVSVENVLRECVNKLTNVAQQQHVSLSLRSETDRHIMADEEKLRSMFLNLIDNAIKYNHTGGTVEIIQKIVDAGVVVQIRDTGRGIPADEVPSIFNRFNRGSASRSERDGCGLGLAIASRIAQLHHGSIEVQSTFGTGSVFTVELPAEQES
ncbi:MAG: HAMP domain-containing sensor histidine kinase [Ignavibacteriales bacterium]|nr:HAMP domain-containing sensor histidine kinase [Ignavibacteriales bacterium]